jgi:hypothetical protein
MEGRNAVTDSIAGDCKSALSGSTTAAQRSIEIAMREVLDDCRAVFVSDRFLLTPTMH